MDFLVKRGESRDGELVEYDGIDKGIKEV